MAQIEEASNTIREECREKFLQCARMRQSFHNNREVPPATRTTASETTRKKKHIPNVWGLAIEISEEGDQEQNHTGYAGVGSALPSSSA